MDSIATTSSRGVTSPPRQGWRHSEPTAAIRVGNGCHSISLEWERFHVGRRKVNPAESERRRRPVACGVKPQARRYRDERELAASMETASNHAACNVFG